MKEQKSKSNLYELLIPLLITSAVTVLGWWYIENKNSERDRNNKLREIKLTYLITAYNKLANASQRTSNADKFNFDMESAISEIQLFGTEYQIELLNNYLDQINDPLKKNTASLDPLLRELRNSLRKEININPIEDNVRWLRTSEYGLDSINKVLFPKKQLTQ